MTDRGVWTQTRSGRAFYPQNPLPEDIDLQDIAHALSNLCRFSGHTRRFYSVAEHSVLVSQHVPPEHAMQALLHDATEAYLVDVPKPIKPLLVGYEELEHKVWLAVAAHFNVPVEMHQAVKDADVAVLLAEKDQLLGPSPRQWYETDIKPANTGEIQCLAPREAKYLFLSRFAVLHGARMKEVA